MAITEASNEDVPADVTLIRDFVNTVEWQVDADSWSSPSELADWLADRTTWTRVDLDVDDLALARRLREGVRSILLTHAGHDPLPQAVTDLDDALGLIPMRMSFGDDGQAGLSSAGGAAVAPALAEVLAAVARSHADGTWSRLKACSRDSCRWAYWDGSRNRSGRWCSMAGCGNFIKMRRRDGEASDVEGLVIGSSGGRRATLVDVAGLAGVSIKTVSNVVTGTVRVADATRARVIAAIEELDYHPDLAARALVNRRGRQKPPTSAGSIS